MISANNTKKLGEWVKGSRTRWIIFDEQVDSLDKQYMAYQKQVKSNPLFSLAKLPLDVSLITTSNTTNPSDNLNTSMSKEHTGGFVKRNMRMSALEQSQANIKMMQSTYKDIS